MDTPMDAANLNIEKLRAIRGDFQLEISNLVLERGKVHGVLGASGSGKSTLVSALTGFLPLEEAHVDFAGRRLDTLWPEQREIAWVPQRGALLDFLSVRKNVQLALEIQRKPSGVCRATADEMLAKVGAGAWADRMPGALSVGQAQRVALARAFATGFSLLLLDEPTSALDVGAKAEMRECILEETKRRNLCTLLVSHDPEDAEICHRIYAFRMGSLIGTCPGDEFRAEHPLYRALYLP